MRVTLRVEEGDVVDKHQPVARLRIGSLGDWKTVLAPVNGAVERVLSPSGSQVKGNAPLIRLQARPDARALAVSVGLIEGASEGAIEIAEDVLRLAATSNGALTQPEIAVFCEKDSPKEIHEAISLLVKNGRAKRNGAVFVFPDYA